MSSPIATHFPGSSPSRDSPNAHPYAIKSSSSAVLTRSNSTGHRNIANHHYTPLSPIKHNAVVKQSHSVSSHRHTKSMSSANEDMFAKPPPVPLPPSSTVLVGLANKTFGSDGIVSDGEGIPLTPPMTWRIKRSQTLSSVFPNKSDSETSLQDLPKNPKIWTPRQLSVYLSSSLRLKGDVKLPVPVMRDIAAFVVQEHLSGKAFLRMKREDYDHLGINQLWKDALLEASRALRQSLIQGRIMGPGTPLSPRSTEGILEQDEDLPSSDPPVYSSLPSSRRDAPHQWEEDKKRMSKTTFRAGRVRGMVETYERSVSGSSGSGSDCEGEDDNVPDIVGVDCTFADGPDAEEAGFASGELTSGSEDETSEPKISEAKIVLAPPVSPLYATSAFTPSVGQGVELNAAEDAPPSVEALLREQEQNGTRDKYHFWGARAWEDELENPHGVNVTAKRVPLSMHNTAQRISLTEWPNTMPHPGAENARTSLAQIFEQPACETRPSPPKATRDASVGVDEAQLNRSPGPEVYEALEALKQRLEVVERRLDELERRDAERNAAASKADATHKSEQNEPEMDYRTALMLNFARPPDALYTTNRASKESHHRNYSDADPSVTGLPRYMLLVSLGVAAVVTRVVLRRVVGDKKRT